MIKRFIIAIVLLVLVCGGIVGFNLFRDKAIKDFFANMPVAPLTVSTETVVEGPWTPGIEAIGTISAAQGVDLTVETTGIVQEILFKANDRVERGQVLVQLDDAIQRADLESAKTQVGLDKLALDRAIELQKRGVGSDQSLDAARAAWETSTAQVARVQAVLNQKQLKAPFGGTIGIPRIDDGQYMQPGTIVATLQDLQTLRVDFSVPEQQLGLLKIGQPVAYGLTADDLPYRGTVTGIDPKVDPSSRLVSVRAEITNAPEGTLVPGQFLQVRVELPREDKVLAVAQTSLVSSLYGDFVFVIRPAEPKPAAAAETPADAQKAEAPAAAPAAAAPQSVARQIFVQIGRRSEGKVEITSGLVAGDEVVTAGQNRLSNGSPVVIDNTIDPTRPRSEQASAR